MTLTFSGSGMSAVAPTIATGSASRTPLARRMSSARDAGKPIVESDPTAPGALVLLEMARNLAGRGRGLAGMQLGLSPTAKA